MHPCWTLSPAPPGTPRGSSTGLRSPLPPQRPSAPPPLQRRPSQLALRALLSLSLLDVVDEWRGKLSRIIHNNVW